MDAESGFLRQSARRRSGVMIRVVLVRDGFGLGWILELATSEHEQTKLVCTNLPHHNEATMDCKRFQKFDRALENHK